MLSATIMSIGHQTQLQQDFSEQDFFSGTFMQILLMASPKIFSPGPKKVEAKNVSPPKSELSHDCVNLAGIFWGKIKTIYK
jgi:hypothetical protein